MSVSRLRCLSFLAAFVFALYPALSSEDKVPSASSVDNALMDLLQTLEATDLDDEGIRQLLQTAARKPETGDSSDSEEFEYFEKHVRPLLAERCWSCHGPEKQESGLRLDRREALFAGGERGPVLDLAEPAKSLLLLAIGYEHTPKMPPDERLPSETVDRIAEWVSRGAPWPTDSAVDPALPSDGGSEWARENHWAFKPLDKPSPPSLENPDGSFEPVDTFISNALEASGLGLSEEADKQTLLRRVTYDLTGLPPTPEEVCAFLHNESPEAYAQVVERLLASPRYGERWGRYWLDVARYADTKGYVFLEERKFPFSHTYRDYVIRAFNEDLPYDRFILEQLAADQLEGGEDDRALAALGFLTLGRRFINNVHDITDDRIDVVTRGFLGLTVTCARCHDHKYDPIPSEDYYSLYGIFRSSEVPESLPLIGKPNTADPEYQAYLEELRKREGAYQTLRRQAHSALLQEGRERIGDYWVEALEIWSVTDTQAMRASANAKGLSWRWVKRWRDFLKAQIEAEVIDPVFAPLKRLLEIPSENWSQAAPAVLTAISNREGEFAQTLPLLASAMVEDSTQILHAYPEAGQTQTGRPQRGLFKTYAALFQRADRAWQAELASAAQRSIQSGSTEVRLPEGLLDPDLERLRSLLYAPDAPLQIPFDKLENFVDGKTKNQLRDKRNEIENLQATHPGRPDRAMVLVDSEKPFDPYVFKRGKPDNQGEAVSRRFLAVLSPGERRPYTHGSGRLELARDIASPTNPLTARVLVNRVWMHHFGRPLVATPSDFGLRSEPPTHPELLDYLAARFVEEGWSVKNLHRWILFSHTYRQSSHWREEGAILDPENKLLWRQNPRRLDFEAMRDSLLVASGNLNLSMGGDAVEITQPPYSNRRTVYSLIERQNLPGVFRTFDFASPDAHSPKRFSTTVPQQALFLMNSPFLAQESRSLANRSCVAPGLPDEDRLRNLYSILFQRDPSDEEIQLGLNFIATLGEPPPPPQTLQADWEYGTAELAGSTGELIRFSRYPFFGDNTWKGGTEIPDATLGWSMVGPEGGHPGNSLSRASARRWISPVSGTVAIDSALSHGTDQGDGVYGSILVNGIQLVWSGRVFNAEVPASLTGIRVQPGDSLDFVVACGESEGYDSYRWAPVVRLTAAEGDYRERREWKAAADFAGPPPPPLGPWEQYAQALLMTNEFHFLD